MAYAKYLRVRRHATQAGRSTFTLAVPKRVARRLDSRIRYEVSYSERSGIITYRPLFRSDEPRQDWEAACLDRRTRAGRKRERAATYDEANPT